MARPTTNQLFRNEIAAAKQETAKLKRDVRDVLSPTNAIINRLDWLDDDDRTTHVEMEAANLRTLRAAIIAVWKLAKED